MILFRIRRYTIGVHLSLRWIWWSRHEYWDRLIIGPIFVWRAHPPEYWAEREREMHELFPDDAACRTCGQSV